MNEILVEMPTAAGEPLPLDRRVYSCLGLSPLVKIVGCFEHRAWEAYRIERMVEMVSA